jgi:hypothetical protein
MTISQDMKKDGHIPRFNHSVFIWPVDPFSEFGFSFAHHLCLDRAKLLWRQNDYTDRKVR